MVRVSRRKFNRKWSIGFERLEDRRLLVGETIAFELDVTQNGASILDANRVFEVDEGERVKLQVQYDDLRTGTDQQGLWAMHADIISNAAGAFIPVVTERTELRLIGDLDFLTGGSLLVGAEGTTETRMITLEEFGINTARSVGTAIAEVLDIDPSVVEVEVLMPSDTQIVLSVRYLDDALALTDIPNVFIDTSGLIGPPIDSVAQHIPAYVNNDPNQGVNPEAFVTAVDFHSSSFNDMEVYNILQSGTYNPNGPNVFADTGGVSDDFFASIAERAALNGIPFDGLNFHAFSICLQAVNAQSGVTFTAAFPTSADVLLYPVGSDALESLDVLIDLDDDPLELGDDRFGMVTANILSSVPRPYQNPVNRFDVNNDGEDGNAGLLALLRDLNTLQTELTERNVSDPVTGKLPDVPPGAVTTFFDVNGDGFATQADVQAIMDEFGVMTDDDFGDAPSPYPTLLPDGARHAESALFLGSLIDTESDGQPSVDADGDGIDEDGVVWVTDLVATPEGDVVATALVTASAPGKLDGWIDFDRNGSWADAGEQLFAVSRDLVAGENLVSFTIPSGASPGDTYARFRLSSTGGLGPSGSASDGEVEDYFVSLVDGGAGTTLLVDLMFGDAEVRSENSEVVLSQGGVEVFRSPGTAISGWNFVGTAGDDMVGLGNLASAQPTPVPMMFDGSTGTDSLWLIDSDQTLDLTDSAQNMISDVEVINIVGASPNELVIDGQSVIDSTDAGNTLTVVHDEDDTVEYSGAAWTVNEPIFVGGQQNHVVVSGAATVQVINTRPHQNPLERTDVNFEEGTTSLDALQIITLLGEAATQPVVLLPPTSAAELPSRYYDVNGSNTASALDVLNVINELGRQLGRQLAGELVVANASPPITAVHAGRVLDDVAVDGDSLRLPKSETPDRLTDVSGPSVKKATPSRVEVDSADYESAADLAIEELFIRAELTQ